MKSLVIDKNLSLKRRLELLSGSLVLRTAQPMDGSVRTENVQLNLSVKAHLGLGVVLAQQLAQF